MSDALIKGGKPIDGTGKEAFTADIGIIDGMIAEIGKVSSNAKQLVNANGAIVSPGWVDTYIHYDGPAYLVRGMH